MDAGGLKFIADENISPVLVHILRKLGAKAIESIHSKPEKGFPDTDWIPLYTGRGYIIISLDRKQLRVNSIARIIAESGARMIYLPRRFADSKRWDQAQWLLKRWPQVTERATQMSPDGEVVVFHWDGRTQTVGSPAT